MLSDFLKSQMCPTMHPFNHAGHAEVPTAQTDAAADENIFELATDPMYLAIAQAVSNAVVGIR